MIKLTFVDTSYMPAYAYFIIKLLMMLLSLHYYIII